MENKIPENKQKFYGVSLKKDKWPPCHACFSAPPPQKPRPLAWPAAGPTKAFTDAVCLVQFLEGPRPGVVRPRLSVVGPPSLASTA